MALPGSGQITWEMIRAEFGGGYPIYASQYYRGGGLVPNSAGNAGIPTGGTLYASQFYNASKASLSAPDINNGVFRNEPAPMTVAVTGSSTASGSGLSGGTWTRTSGGTSPTSASGVTLNVSASVNKNSTAYATYRFDGNNGLSINITVALTYSTDF